MRWHQVPTIGRVLIGALVGVLIVAGVGLLLVRLLQGGDGFDDLAVAAVTTVFGIPLGAILGGAIGWWSGRGPQDPTGNGSANETSTSV